MQRIINHPASRRLAERSVTLVGKLEIGLPRLLLIWTTLASFGCGLRLAFAVTPDGPPATEITDMLFYVLVVLAPVATGLFALHLFPANAFMPQPRLRIARFGQWRRVNAVEAQGLPLFGATGFMASLLVGMLLNIPVRTVEFLTAIPALGGMAPAWFQVLHAMMMVDVVLLSSLYAFAFVMALRHVPGFPRFLAAVWAIDILMQIGIARVMGAIPNLPPAVAHSLGAMLEGNLKKVLISVAIWLPYLLLSRRVNLTYRARVPA